MSLSVDDDTYKKLVHSEDPSDYIEANPTIESPMSTISDGSYKELELCTIESNASKLYARLNRGSKIESTVEGEYPKEEFVITDNETHLPIDNLKNENSDHVQSVADNCLNKQSYVKNDIEGDYNDGDVDDDDNNLDHAQARNSNTSDSLRGSCPILPENDNEYEDYMHHYITIIP